MLTKLLALAAGTYQGPFVAHITNVVRFVDIVPVRTNINPPSDSNPLATLADVVPPTPIAFIADAPGGAAIVTGPDALAVGSGAQAGPNVQSTASGNGAQAGAGGPGATATGSGANAPSAGSTATGATAQATGLAATAEGAGAVASGVGAVAQGNNAVVQSARATGIGTNVGIPPGFDDSTTVGFGSGAGGAAGGCAFGSGAQTAGGISLGKGVTGTPPGTTFVGDAALSPMAQFRVTGAAGLDPIEATNTPAPNTTGTFVVVKDGANPPVKRQIILASAAETTAAFPTAPAGSRALLVVP